MFLRVALLAFLATLLFLSPAPALGAASGPLLRGQEIDQNTTIYDTTGICSCEVKWFTVGLAPGTVSIAADLRSATFNRGPTYGLSVLLLHGSSTVTWGKTACTASQVHCNKWVRLTHRVTSRGVYYLEIIGLGAEIIPYALTVRGAIYRLHCHRYC
jgi:hypothetical protein